MKPLIPINYESDRPTVSGRELHKFLQVDTPYRIWFPRMCEYGFAEGTDYTPYNFVHPQNKQEYTDHQLTVPMAKELAMLQRNERGKQARQYFIQVEAEWNTPEKVMARALVMANKKIEALESAQRKTETFRDRVSKTNRRIGKASAISELCLYLKDGRAEAEVHAYRDLSTLSTGRGSGRNSGTVRIDLDQYARITAISVGVGASKASVLRTMPETALNSLDKEARHVTHRARL